MKKLFYVLMLSLIFSACGDDEKSASGDQKDTKQKNQAKDTNKGANKEANKDDDDDKDDQEGKKNINDAALIGKWVNKENNTGFDIQAGGKISSVNMATLDYNSWKLEGNILTLNSTSKGVANPVTTDEVYKVRSIKEKRLSLSPMNNLKARLIYEKN